jgi:SAM-dependent methyltransferase
MPNHLPEVREEMRACSPKVGILRRPEADRFSVVESLRPNGCVGIELGVAGGGFSAAMVRTERFAKFFGVDAYSGGHSANEYKAALKATGLWSNYRLLRLTCSQAVDLFPDASFDFVYVDGFAHSGCEGGRTLEDWYPKLKPGGIMAGDDYDPNNWPLVVWAVHEMAAQLEVSISVFERVAKGTYDRFPSWSVTRPTAGPDELSFTKHFRNIADAEKARIDELRKRKRQEQRSQAQLKSETD